MNTLLLRLAGPLQAWGIGSKFDRRETQRMPTKSGVIGLLAAALGRRREDDISDLSALRMGVRTDQAGELLRDYHTAQGGKNPYITNRYYLSDAVFLVGLQGDMNLLNTLASALRTPAFPLFLGRRSCPPEGRVFVGIREGKDLMAALSEEPWQASAQHRKAAASVASLQMMVDAEPDATGAFFLWDLPLSFSQANRLHGQRSAFICSVPLPGKTGDINSNKPDATLHDAMLDWGD